MNYYFKLATFPQYVHIEPKMFVSNVFRFGRKITVNCWQAGLSLKSNKNRLVEGILVRYQQSSRPTYIGLTGSCRNKLK